MYNKFERGDFMKKRLNLTIDQTLLNKLKIMAHNYGLSMSAYLRMLIADQWNVKENKREKDES